jgi:PPM family protein phosphatase
MRLDISVASERGQRERNEDALTADAGSGFFAVADGIGGELGGEVASRTVISSLARFFESSSDVTADPVIARVQLDVAIRLAHRRLVEESHAGFRHMGTTLAALLLRGDHVVYAHVGDSRIYRLRDGTLERLTIDHSVREPRVVVSAHRGGVYVESLTRAIAARSEVIPDHAEYESRRGDVVLICSDGVSRPLGDSHLGRVLAGPWSDPARVLVSCAIASGGTDNASAIVLRF